METNPLDRAISALTDTVNALDDLRDSIPPETHIAGLAVRLMLRDADDLLRRAQGLREAREHE